MFAHHAEVVECFFGLFAVDKFGAEAEIFCSDSIFLVGVTAVFGFVEYGIESEELVEGKRD